MPRLKSSERPDETLEKIIGDPVLRREWIKFQLRINGSSLSALANSLDITRQAVQKALYSSYPKIERAIAAKIGMKPEAIWPERYQKAA